MNAIEKVEVDNKDRPIEDIIVQRAQVFVDPFQEADEQLAAERIAEAQRLAQEESNNRLKNKSEGSNALKVYRSGVGKYVQFNDEQAK